MTELRKRMIETLQLGGLSERTQEAYVRSVRQLAPRLSQISRPRHRRRTPTVFLCIKNVKKYLRPTTTIALCGIKFFFERTLGVAMDNVQPDKTTAGEESCRPS